MKPFHLFTSLFEAKLAAQAKAVVVPLASASGRRQWNLAMPFGGTRLLAGHRLPFSGVLAIYASARTPSFQPLHL
jgi:hypothetical protein